MLHILLALAALAVLALETYLTLTEDRVGW